MRKTSIILTIILTGLMASAYGQSSISNDIHIDSGEKVVRKVSSVSGDISIGKKAKVESTITTVSGDVEIGAKARVENIKVVSGDISIAKGARVETLVTVSGDVHLYGENDVKGSLETVSGDINCESGSSIDEGLTTVSGDIELDDTFLKGDMVTVSGDISLFNGTVINGDIIIKRKLSTSQFNMGKLKVIIDLNSIVKGSVRVTEPNTNVIVYLSNGGKVEGEVINAEVRKQ